MAEGASDTTRDTFFGGRLVLEQPAKGHRSGTDAVLLAAAVPRSFAGFAYDVGAGAGAAGLGVALFCPQAQVRLVDKNAGAVALSGSNAAANGMADRVAAVSCDVLIRQARVAGLPQKADLVLTNPPFRDARTVRPSPDAARRAAHVLASGATLHDWIAACLDLLSGRGVFLVIHEAGAVPVILDALAGRAGAIALLPIHPRCGEPARRVIVRAVKGSRAPFALAPPLHLHQGQGFTAVAERLHRGEGTLDWG